MIAPQPAKTRAKTPIPSAAARRIRLGRPFTLASAADGGGGEDVPHRIERAGDEAEIAPRAAGLALDQARLDQHFQVVTDRALREVEEGLELANANGLTVGS